MPTSLQRSDAQDLLGTPSRRVQGWTFALLASLTLWGGLISGGLQVARVWPGTFVIQAGWPQFDNPPWSEGLETVGIG